MAKPGSMGRRRAVRKAGIAALLIVAALVLSGCWATYHRVYNIDVVTMRQKNTDETIAFCHWVTAGRGPFEPAKCALDMIRWAHATRPVPGFDRPLTINLSTDHREENVHNMYRAIGDVLGNRECIQFVGRTIPDHDGIPVYRNFWRAEEAGYFGCGLW